MLIRVSRNQHRSARPISGAEPGDCFRWSQEACAPDSPSAIQDAKRYLQDFDRLQKTAKADQDLFDQMTALYPDCAANQSWLMFGFPEA